MMRPLPYETIGPADHLMVRNLFLSQRPLSGYLAGRKRGGYYVQMLEEEWASTFHVKHAIACNSATSGLLAAAFAIGLMPRDKFAVSPMTMSATVAAPMFTGATPIFCDVWGDDFAISTTPTGAEIKAVFMTNLFGHPGPLHAFRRHADTDGTFLIEDNSQSPFAMEGGKYAGTIGHIGVFSLNIHKPLQCGEGGVIVTDDDGLADKLRDFINHGEVTGGQIGLNLRMPELCAAVAISQLRHGRLTIEERVCQAEAILAAIGTIPGLPGPVVRKGCSHVYYTIPFLIAPDKRAGFCAHLRSAGVPVVEGYGAVNRLPAFAGFGGDCPMADGIHERLFYIENCAWTFTGPQISQIGNAFKSAAVKVL